MKSFPILAHTCMALVSLLNLMAYLALASPNSRALLSWSGVQQQLSHACTLLYARGAAGVVGPPLVSELLDSPTVRTLWESGVTGIKLYPCHLTAPMSGDIGSWAGHRYRHG